MLLEKRKLSLDVYVLDFKVRSWFNYNFRGARLTMRTFLYCSLNGVI